MKQLRKLRNEEVIILEQGKNAEIQDNIECCPSFRLALRISLSDEQSATPRAKRSEGNKQQKAPIPPAIKHIARHHHECVLQLQLVFRLANKTVEDEPIEQKDYRQKYGELNGIEKHIILAGFKVAKV